MNASKNSEFRRPALWRHPVLLTRRLLRSWPIVLWVLAIGLAIFFYSGSTRLSGMLGSVETVVVPIAPLETARLLTINVQVGQRVNAGDVVATMDTLLFDAQAAIDEAQMIEVEGTMQGYQQRVLEFVHDFATETSQARFELEAQRLDQSRDASVLAVLRDELNNLEGLRQKGLVSDRELASLRPEIAALEQTVAAYPALLAMHEERLRTAQQEEQTMRDLLSEGQQESLDVLATIQDMRKAMTEIIRTSRERREIQRDGYTLRASSAGIVSLILYDVGDIVSAGDPVLRLVGEHPQRVIGFLPEVHLSDVKSGDAVTVWRTTADARAIPALVQSIAPEIEALPGRVSPIRGNPLRGRRIVVQCQSGTHDLIPGETVRVQLSEPSMFSWLDTFTGE